MPSSPRWPSSAPSSRGSVPSSNHCATWGNTRSRTYARTVSRTMSSSSENSPATSMKSTGSGTELALENAREFVEERLGRALELVLETPPKEAPIGVRQDCIDAILHDGLFAEGGQVEPVRPVEAVVLETPNDPLLWNGLL